MAEGLVFTLAEFAVAARGRRLDDVLIGPAKGVMRDLLGVAVAGSGQEAVAPVYQVARKSSTGGPATVLVSGDAMSAAVAAMVNGTMAHALDFDDTHLPSILHPSASVVPSVLATAQATGAPGADLLTAVMVGDEIACRLGMAAFDTELGNSVFFERGQHATSICGAIGAAAGSALVAGADVSEVANAMAIAASLGAGILEANRVGGSVKPFHCGWAAHAGVTAAELAVAAMTGPYSALEGRFGFFKAHTDWYDETALLDGLGQRWEAARLFIKPYPTNHFTHAGIDAALELTASGIDIELIETLELGVPAPVLRTIAEPAEEKARPRSGHHAKFSGPFTVATALLGGSGLGVSAADFTDASVTDPRRLDLASRVRCVADEDAGRSYPYEFPAVLRASLVDGTVREHRVEHTRGGPNRPLSESETNLKFRLNVEPILGAEQTDRLLASIDRLDQMNSVREMAECLKK